MSEGRYRTLIRVLTYSDDSNTLLIVVPAWDPDVGVTLRKEDVPPAVWNAVVSDGIQRLHARANLAADADHELAIDSWEIDGKVIEELPSSTVYYAEKCWHKPKALAVWGESSAGKWPIVHEFYPSNTTRIQWASLWPTIEEVREAMKVIEQVIKKAK